MKALNFALALFTTLSASASMASVCIVSGSNGGYWQDGKARVIISCNKGNPDSKTIVAKDGDLDMPTAMESLIKKGYKIASQDKEGDYTFTK